MMRVLMEFAEGIRAEKSPEVRESDFFLSLMASLAIQRRERLATVSLCPAYGTSSPGAQTIRGSIGTIVLNSLPFPDESTSLERIIAFKNDPDKKRKRELLQRWTHRLAVKGISSEHEVTQELEWALHDYEEHMRFHKMKANRGILETVVATSAEIAEDLVKFRWGKLAQSLFSTSHREIDLLEAELKAPGRELAYVSKARTQLE
jgi:hypothetical protein